MKDAARYVFLTRHGDIRSGWKIMIFLVGTAFLASGVVALARVAGPASDIVDAVLLLTTVLFVTWVIVRFVNRKPLAAIGLWFHPRALRELGMGLLVGFLMMSGIFIVLLALGYAQAGWLGRSYGEILFTLVYAVAFFSIAAASEEVLFRGYVFQTLSQGITVLPAILIMSSVFGIGHMNNPNANALSTANVVLAGIWLSLAYQKTRSLWLPFGLHMAWNFTQTTVYGFPTSGITFSEHQLWNATVAGPEWITGGPFGPEGSVLATLALILGTWYILKSGYLAAPEGIITLDSVEDVLPLVPPSGGPPADGAAA
jgi:membrane protease YdiL (CAAX protease family)